MNAPAAKIKMLRNSMRCFVLGLLGLLPAIGVPFALLAVDSRTDPHSFFWFCFAAAAFSLVGFPCAVAALVTSATVYAREKLHWNAARPYRVWGDVSAVIGVIAAFIVLVLIAFTTANFGGTGG